MELRAWTETSVGQSADCRVGIVVGGGSFGETEEASGTFVCSRNTRFAKRIAVIARDAVLAWSNDLLPLKWMEGSDWAVTFCGRSLSTVFARTTFDWLS